MDKAFNAVKRRALALRKTEAELAAAAGVSYPTYWRAREGKTGDEARMKVLRRLEAKLDEIEAANAPAVALCGLCEKRADDPTVRGCITFGCPLTKKQAA